MEEPQAPDPFETVRVLKSDFDLLQAAANAAHEDYLQLCELLAVEPPEGVAPRQVMYDEILPRIVKLIETQIHVSEATEVLRERAKRFGNKTLDLGGGRKGLLVGKRLAPGVLEESRRERRARERDERRGR